MNYAGLQLGDFDLYRKTIVVTGKGSKRRPIPISPELVATVDEYLLTEYPLLEQDANRDRLHVVRRLQGRPARHRAEAGTDALLPRLL